MNNQHTSAWPLPPIYFEEYTDYHMDLIEKSLDSTSEDSSALEVQHLLPPAYPVNNEFKLFGVERTLENTSISSLKTLSNQNFKEYQKKSKKLKKLNKSLIFNYLSLIEILSVNPIQSESCRLEIKECLTNMLDLANEFRPIQALEHFKVLLNNQLDKTENSINLIKEFESGFNNQINDLITSHTKEELSSEDETISDEEAELESELEVDTLSEVTYSTKRSLMNTSSQVKLKKSSKIELEKLLNYKNNANTRNLLDNQFNLGVINKLNLI